MPARSPHAGGYNAAAARQLEQVQIPDKIKCKLCKKVKMQSAYSKRQLGDLRTEIFHNGKINTTVTAYVRCRQCTAQQNNELTCIICDEIKPLDGFAKAQRRNADTARCLNCVYMHLSVEPGVEPVDSDDDDSNSNPYDSDDLYGAYDSEDPIPTTTLNGFSKLSVTDPSMSEIMKPGGTVSLDGGVALPHQSAHSSNSGQGDGTWQSFADSAWLEQEREDRLMKNPTGVGIPFTGYDPYGLAHSRVRASSTIATEHTTGMTGTVGERATPLTGGGGFAKIKAAKKTTRLRYRTSGSDDDDYPSVRVGGGKSKATVPASDADEGDEETMFKEW
ncbi:MAG: hypothetical protein M1827_004980 [Pycnora praestabilis]|nr:MAG: hypothetical protein M1827_004980 [Pycnora praestabilis]